MLPDGTKMFESLPILNYVGAVHGLRPTDPLTAYKGDKAIARIMDDYFNKRLLPAVSGDDKEAIKNAVVDEHIKLMQDLTTKCLTDDHKFICGDTLTVADFVCGGFYFNIVLNPRNKRKELWTEGWKEAPERMKKYVQEFGVAMSSYLKDRPKCEF